MTKITCKHCGGKGETDNYTKLRTVEDNEIWVSTKICMKCFGDGWFDWIELIRGKDLTKAGFKIQEHHSTIHGDCDEYGKQEM